MKFRNAGLDDLPVIVAIYNSTIAGRMVTADLKPVQVAEKINWYNNHTADKRPLWMVETDEDEVIGWVSFQDFYGRPAYAGTAEVSIYLDEKYRGKGFGKKILEYVFTKCKGLCIDTLLGFIFAHNAASIQMFMALGFEEWGHLKDIANMDGELCSLKIFGKKIF
ncbi:MAG: N-acetyltransferase [Bacteroidetes bacterium]|nr:N-acetyltransferase [Bacteroidota bacterium]MBS1757104.1 N-acetyltransferase [Bacteroidota bacterium]